MIVLSKKQAQNESIKSLFQNKGTFTLKDKKVFCTGHYNKSIIGDNVIDIQGVKIVYAEKRYNKEYKSFYKLYSIHN